MCRNTIYRYGNPDKKAGQPFILDPANPFDNLYDSAVKPYAKGRARGDTHNWGAFVEKIGTLDLTRSLYENLGIDLKVMEVIDHALKVCTYMSVELGVSLLLVD